MADTAWHGGAWAAAFTLDSSGPPAYLIHLLKKCLLRFTTIRERERETERETERERDRDRERERERESVYSVSQSFFNANHRNSHWI